MCVTDVNHDMQETVPVVSAAWCLSLIQIGKGILPGDFANYSANEPAIMISLIELLSLDNKLTL